MFCLVKLSKGSIVNRYAVGSEVELCLIKCKRFHFKANLDHIKESGQIVLTNLKVYSNGEYMPVDGHIETGVYELLFVEAKGTRKAYSNVALSYVDGGDFRLISEDGEIVPRDKDVVLTVSSDIGVSVYTGVFDGVVRGNSVGLRDVSISSKLHIVSGEASFSHTDYLVVDLDEDCECSVEGFGKVKIVLG